MTEARDRYPIPPTNGPASMADELADLRRRVGELEGAPASTGELTLTQHYFGSPAFIVVTAGYQSIAQAYLPFLAHPAVRAWGSYNFSDGATTGQIKVSAREGGVEVASTVSPILPAGSSGTWSVDWLHGLELGEGPLDRSLLVQAQSTAGAGDFNVLEPTMLMLFSDATATAAGAWSTP